MDAFKTLLFAHAACGTAALATYWAAAFARKGSPLHRGVGKAYLLAMIGIVVTAIPMAITFYFRGLWPVAVFLGYLTVITSTSMWLGWRSIRRKRDQAAFRDKAYIAVAIANLACAVTVFAIGAQVTQVLLMGFSVVGLLAGLQMLWRAYRPMAAGNWWLQEHYGAMLGCGVATHVAFLNLGFGRVAQMLGYQPPAWYQLLGWMVPVAAAVIAGIVLDRRYAPKAKASMARTAAAA